MRAVQRQLLAKGIPQEFERRGGVAYRKRFWSAERSESRFTWQKFFFTNDVEEALSAVRKLDVNATVSDSGLIEFQEVLPATWEHPTTGEQLWFNGVHTNHESYYKEAEHIDTSDGSPMTTAYADGTVISNETLAEIRSTMWKSSVACSLQTGDVVVVDNMLVSHGRMGWEAGHERKMLLTHFS